MSTDRRLARLDQQTWLERELPELRAELEALRTDELIPLNVDVPSAICTVYGVLPKLQLLRPRIAEELPRFDLQAFDRLELYVAALSRVHAYYRSTTEPPDGLPDLIRRASTLRAQLLADAHALALRGHLDPATLRNLKTRPGPKALAVDLGALAHIFRKHAPTLVGKSVTPAADLALADGLSVDLLRTIGRRQFAQAIAVAAQLRLRAFTLLARTYDDARRAVTYLCAKRTDPNTIAPSLYAGRKRRPRAKRNPEVPNGFANDERGDRVRPAPMSPNQRNDDSDRWRPSSAPSSGLTE